MAHLFQSLSADESALEPLRITLLSKHLAAADRSAVAQTCIPAQTWLLNEWPNAAFCVPVRAGEAPTALKQRAQLARRQLSRQRQRGRASVTLAIVQRGQMTASDQWYESVFEGLSGTEPSLPTLSLRLQLQHIPAALLSLAGQALPGLSTLTLGRPDDEGGCAVVLPQGNALASVRHLTVYRVAPASQATFWASLQGLSQQIASMSIRQQSLWQENGFISEEADVQTDGPYPYRRPMWVAAFSHTSWSALTQLEVPDSLNPWLVRLLQRSAPVGVVVLCTHTHTQPLPSRVS